MNPTRLALFMALAVFAAVCARSPRRCFTYGRVLLLALATLVIVAPFVWLLAAIFKDRTAFDEYLFLPPPAKWSSGTMNLDNFRELFRGKPSVGGTVYFWQYVLNSTVYATVNTVLNVFFCSLAGFALAKYEFRGKAWLMTLMLGSMTVPPALLLAPLYKMVVDLGMVDSLVGLIVPGMVNAYGIFLFRQACMGVPDEMLDAGRIDGCSEIALYFRLAMPLVRPMAAAFSLMTFLGTWNAFFAPNVFLQTQKNFTIPIVLYMYVDDYQSNFGVFLAGTALAMLPPMVLFFALEKEFISGLTSGAVKG
jgi:multiple sugar transport system permease protein